MSFKTACVFEGNVYQLEFWAQIVNHSITYTVKIGSELSLCMTVIEMIPDDLPNFSGIHWILQTVPTGQKPFRPAFIQQMGKCIEENHQ